MQRMMQRLLISDSKLMCTSFIFCLHADADVASWICIALLLAVGTEVMTVW
jgi:hypothetical protein